MSSNAIRYYFFSGIAALCDFLIFLVAIGLGLTVAAASFVSTGFGIFLSYGLTSRFVFNEASNLAHFRRYLIVALCVVGLATIAIPLLSGLLELEWVAKLIWMALQALIQYQVHKRWTFRSLD